MRLSKVKRILYASGSGAYGEADVEFREDHHPMEPISTYGASKLAGEALICAYAHMFDMSGLCFRFGGDVGPRQTHGVGFDFIKGLRRDPRHLRILGEGSQTKSYIAVTDVVSAVLHAHEHARDKRFAAFNVATGDYITVLEIAKLACEIALRARGGQGRIPVYRRRPRLEGRRADRTDQFRCNSRDWLAGRKADA